MASPTHLRSFPRKRESRRRARWSRLGPRFRGDERDIRQMRTLTIRRPDDWHVHFRDGDMLTAVVPFTARQFARAIVMPNLTPPVTTAAMADAYRARIRASIPAGVTLHAADDLLSHRHDRSRPISSPATATASSPPPSSIPPHATTNSAHGVTSIDKIDRVLAAMAEHAHSAAGPRRVGASRGRHFRPREGVHRRRAAADAGQLSQAQGRDGARHHRGGRRGRARPSPAPRRHADAPASALQSQRPVPGRHPTAHVLHAGSQARTAPVWRCGRRRPAASRASFSAPTRRRICAISRRRPAVAPAYSAHQLPYKHTLRCSPRRARSTVRDIRLAQRAGLLRPVAERGADHLGRRDAVLRFRRFRLEKLGKFCPSWPVSRLTGR